MQAPWLISVAPRNMAIETRSPVSPRVALYLPDPSKIQVWCEMLANLLPGWHVQSMDSTDPNLVDYAVVWRPRPGDLGKFPQLKAIVSIGAGIDHVLADPSVPHDIPIIRTVGADLTQRMKEYVILHVLRHHRDMPRQLQAQAACDWHAIVVPVAPRRCVGVLGLGNLGRAAAIGLSQVGFLTRGWARSAREIPGVQCFSGVSGLAPFLDGCEILVNLLPLTSETEGILNADLFGQLPPGACIVNCARGGHLDEDDLLDALARGHIKQATLDVFKIEPLPIAHPFWAHPAITITPHIASQIDAETGARLIAQNLHLFHDSGTCADIADAERGY